MATHSTPSLNPALATANPLDQLADIHLPEAVSIWPLAPGWYVLIALLLLLTVGGLWLRQRQRRNAYRREATQALEAALSLYKQSEELNTYLQQFNAILRRTALSAGATPAVLSLKGEAWLAWLDQSAARLPGQFSQQHWLLAAAYQKNPTVDAAEIGALHALALAWVAQHRQARFAITAEPRHV